MAMTPEAKGALRTTVQALRTHLLEKLLAETQARYRLSVRARDAGLDEATKVRRSRLEAWIDEQVRASSDNHARTADDFLCAALKQTAYTLLNRLIILRLMEEPIAGRAPLRQPAVVKGGWESTAYRQFRDVARALRGDDTEGYAFLLQLVFEDLATDLPGLYGPVGVADLIPVPASTLRHVIDEIDKLELETCWADDMTLGWVYQYWNDPEREALDAKLHGGGKLEPHEIASKTQMFTERYMVDWLLQNSLGPMWLAMCRKHGWIPEVEVDGTLERLEARRVEWRAKRDAGEVSLTELMPLHTDAERRWAYYLPQPIPDDAVTHAPETVRDLRMLDPAVGSGHFLVVAMDLLPALYREEARHRGLTHHPDWTERAIVERILSHNLHGIDLDPRAVQIAAAALWLKARQIAPDARPERLNLVASNLRLGSLPDDDAALVGLRQQVERETGIPAALTDTIVQALRGADHLGSLLKVDRAVDDAINAHENTIAAQFAPQQIPMYEASQPQQGGMVFEATAARQSLVERLEAFLSQHTGGDDLGLRLRGQQLAAGVRFARLLRERAYDLVVANPPYQGTSKISDPKYIDIEYKLGKADLYSAFLLRGLDLVRTGGVSAMLTMRNWMFIHDFRHLRPHILENHDLCALGDFDRGAFEDVPDELVSVVVSSFRRGVPRDGKSAALCPTPRDDRSRDNERTPRKRAAALCQMGRCDFDPAALRVVPEWPLVYWWLEPTLARYEKSELLGDVAPVRTGLCTSDNTRFLRKHWELKSLQEDPRWAPYVTGAKGMSWIDPCDERCEWLHNGLSIKTYNEFLYRSFSRVVQNEEFYFRLGVAYTSIGNRFTARAHRRKAIMGKKGSSVFPSDVAQTVCVMNSTSVKEILQSLNPGIDFQVGDVNRLPLFHVEDSRAIFDTIQRHFIEHERHREPSVEFVHPGPSRWLQVQQWAQLMVDRPEGTPRSNFDATDAPEPAAGHLSFALGVALGRFAPNIEGTIDPFKHDLSHALPAGVLFLDGTLDERDEADSLAHPAARPIQQAWKAYGPRLGVNRKSLREWLTLNFFKDVHKNMYESRPIHWPLSSRQRTFVAWVNIHRFTERTLLDVLADHLLPAAKRLEGELSDLRDARDGANQMAAKAAEKRYPKVLAATAELEEFIKNVELCAYKGAPPTDANCPKREQDARYSPNLDDGVMINSAPLWPLLEPQWKDPKKWWKQLSEAKGRKDYDWSHLAMRYWPTRVDEKCQEDPSLGVAHGCFWRYHPARAWAWELRLQDEIGPDFRIEEAPYRPGGKELGDQGDRPHRDAWIRDRAREALAAVEREVVRRMRKRKDRVGPFEMRILETGLWSALPEDVWAMELRLSERWGYEFRLLAPDEPAARASFEADHPQDVAVRTELLAGLVPAINLLGDTDEEGGEDEQDDEDPVEETDDEEVSET